MPIGVRTPRRLTRWATLDVDRAMIDMRSLKDYLQSMPSCNGDIAALGFCAGGELAFLAATRLGAKAVAASHATHIDRHLDEAHKISGRITMHFGGNDPIVPLDKVDAIRNRLASDSRVDVHVYPGAGHGFSFSTQPSYDEVAATESDRRAQQVLGMLTGLIGFFDVRRNVVSPPSFGHVFVEDTSEKLVLLPRAEAPFARGISAISQVLVRCITMEKEGATNTVVTSPRPAKNLSCKRALYRRWDHNDPKL